tara:strand:- start:6604 stop:6864 length:261 start_codon:yes stop_codon:yes gene_type:complete
MKIEAYSHKLVKTLRSCQTNKQLISASRMVDTFRRIYFFKNPIKTLENLNDIMFALGETTQRISEQPMKKVSVSVGGSPIQEKRFA